MKIEKECIQPSVFQFYLARFNRGAVILVRLIEIDNLLSLCPVFTSFESFYFFVCSKKHVVM